MSLQTRPPKSVFLSKVMRSFNRKSNALIFMNFFICRHFLVSKISWLSLSLLLVLQGCSVTALDQPPAGHQPFYQPQANQTLAQIARQQGIPTEVLERYNPRSHPLRPEPQHRLRIPERASDVPLEGPYFYRIQAGDTLSQLAQHFHISVLSLQRANPHLVPERLMIGERIQLPIYRATPLRWPSANPEVKIRYSHQPWGLHQGLAIRTAAREEIFPIAPGRVVFAGELRGFGRVVIVQHTNEMQSIYAYCRALFVDQGAQVSGGHPLCSAGQQRRLDEPGIYFELRVDGQAVPPENYLPALGW